MTQKCSYIIIAHCDLKERHPRRTVTVIKRSIDVGISFVQEEKRLGKSKQKNRINYAKSKHIASDHTVYHCDKRTGQTNGTEISNQCKENTILIMVTYPAKNINKNQDPGTAKISIVSSRLRSPFNRQGIQAKIIKLDIRKIHLGGELV